MTRVLILSASVGSGHGRAAEAIEKALRQTHPNVEVSHQDVLELTNRTFRRIYAQGYLDLVNKAPHVLGYFYDYFNEPSKRGRRDRLRQALERLNVAPIERFVQTAGADLIIHTHFLPAELVAGMRTAGTLSTPHVLVTTDFETHRAWLHLPCERFFTATDEGAEFLACLGVPADCLSVTGIPIDPAFSLAKDQAMCRRKHAIEGASRPVLLQLCGGLGVGPIEQFFEAILRVPLPIELVVVTGRNAELRTKLAALPVPDRHRVQVLGFTTDMDELMTAADLLVSKPGGLTTSEALAKALPMLILNPIPGQESRNSDYLLEQGAAVKANNLSTLPHKLAQLLTDSSHLQRLRENARRLARPRAAFDVVEQSLALLADRPLRRRLP